MIARYTSGRDTVSLSLVSREFHEITRPLIYWNPPFSAYSLIQKEFSDEQRRMVRTLQWNQQMPPKLIADTARKCPNVKHFLISQVDLTPFHTFNQLLRAVKDHESHQPLSIEFLDCFSHRQSMDSITATLQATTRNITVRQTKSRANIINLSECGTSDLLAAVSCLKVKNSNERF